MCLFILLLWWLFRRKHPYGNSCAIGQNQIKQLLVAGFSLKQPKMVVSHFLQCWVNRAKRTELSPSLMRLSKPALCEAATLNICIDITDVFHSLNTFVCLFVVDKVKSCWQMALSLKNKKIIRHNIPGCCVQWYWVCSYLHNGVHTFLMILMIGKWRSCKYYQSSLKESYLYHGHGKYQGDCWGGCKFRIIQKDLRKVSVIGLISSSYWPMV